MDSTYQSLQERDVVDIRERGQLGPAGRRRNRLEAVQQVVERGRRSDFGNRLERRWGLGRRGRRRRGFHLDRHASRCRLPLQKPLLRK